MKPIVIGFYTPSYRDLACQFLGHLKRQNVDCKLYAMDDLGSWERAVMVKPIVVIKARADYPGRPLVLMDVDCECDFSKRSLYEVCTGDDDVSLYVRHRPNAKRKIWASSRVIVWRDTDGASALANIWPMERREGEKSIEGALLRSIERAKQTKIGQLPKQFAGLEWDEAPSDWVIRHHSAHDATRPFWGLQSWLRRTRRGLVSKVVGDYETWKYGA